MKRYQNNGGIGPWCMLSNKCAKTFISEIWNVNKSLYFQIELHRTFSMKDLTPTNHTFYQVLLGVKR